MRTQSILAVDSLPIQRRLSVGVPGRSRPSWQRPRVALRGWREMLCHFPGNPVVTGLRSLPSWLRTVVLPGLLTFVLVVLVSNCAEAAMGYGEWKPMLV